MRVAMIVNSFPSISEKFLINQIVGLIKEGVDVEIYASVPPDAGKEHSLYREFSLQERTIQLGIPRSGPARALRALPILAKNALLHPILVSRAFSTKRYRKAARGFKTLFFLNAFAGKRYDAIHCQFGQNGLIGAFLKDCGFTDRLVVTFHGSDATVYPRKEGRDVYDYLFSRVDSVTVGTTFMTGNVMALGLDREKISVVPAGILTEKYPQTDFAQRDRNMILSIGRLQEVKGFEYSIAAMAILRKRFPELRYLIVGEGSLGPKLQALIDAEGLSDAVFLVGKKDDTEIGELIRKACAFIVPSVRASNGSEEGQGLVVQEAGMAGIPVVAAETGGIPDGVIDGKTGFLVPEKNAEAIAEKVRFLLENPDSAREMGARARDFVSGRYDVAALAKDIAKLYSNR
jgi:colanic acid/amylovoran biosynthesis glycosyltransferase